MTTYDYFKHQVSELERHKAETAHEEHILEFRAMCADMINEAIPGIRQQCMDEMELQRKSTERSRSRRQDVELKISFKDIEKQVRDAFRRVFK